MDDSVAIPNPAPATPAASRLEAQLDRLRGLFTLALAALILLALGVSLFLYRQNSVLRVELAARSEQLRVARQELATKEPILREFMQRLQSFGVNYRDFNRVLTNNAAIINRFTVQAAPPSR